MIGALILLVIMVAVVSAVFHVSAGWAWILVLAAVAGLLFYRSRNPLPYRRITRMGAVFQSVCPFCGKHTKPRATVCHHCGRSLIERREP